MKKIFKTGLVAVCTAAMLIGCGQQGDTAVSETLAENSTAAESIVENTADKTFLGWTDASEKPREEPHDQRRTEPKDR